MSACASGWGNCDAIASNGCEDNLLTDANNCGTCARACAAGISCSGGTCAVSTGTAYINFPLSTDTMYMPPATSSYWTIGSYVDGSRATALASATKATIHIALGTNGLTCDTQDMEMTINGVVVGTFSIHASTTTLDTSFTFSTILGTTYDLRYQTTRTVTSGCGSCNFAATGSTVTLQ